MAVTLFASIEVGSYELEMIIFQIASKGSIKEIDRVSHVIELGKDTYNNKKISFELVDEMCKVLYDYGNIMQEYGVKAYRACAASAVREALNAPSIIDRIKVKTGIDVEVLSNSERRFLSFKAFATREKNFDKIINKGTLLIDMGAGSTQVTLFDKGSLITTQNLRLGALRIREMLAKLADSAADYTGILEEYIDNDIDTLKKIFLKERDIENIIAIGENVTYVYVPKNEDTLEEFCTSEDFNAAYASIINKNEDRLARELDVSLSKARMIIPNSMLLKRIMDCTGAKRLWTPNIGLCDGLLVEYAENNKLIRLTHDFEQDIISAAQVISKRYMCNKLHTASVEKNALKIFDAMKKIHGLSKRERLLLQISALLHDCGKYVSLVYPAEAAYNIITTTEIIGLSHMERIMVANIVKYNTMPYEYGQDEVINGKYGEISIIISKLTAILKLANALDRSHKQKMNDVNVKVNNDYLIITTDTYNDITLEQGLLEPKSALFEEVYGLKPIIKLRKI